MAITIQEAIEAPQDEPGSGLADQPAVAKPAKASRGRGPWRTSLVGLGLLALAVFNAWWYWRDTRPLADRKTLAQWMIHQGETLAESDLREQLRRSPNDGEARLTLARLLAARNDLLGCARQLHEVPFWFPKKGEALYREGSAYLLLNRAKDAEAAWLEVLKADPLHPRSTEIYHDAFFEMMKLLATEDRWEDAYVLLWRAYDQASPDDRLTLLLWRMRAELERVSPAESLPRLQKYVEADPHDFEAIRALGRAEQSLGKLDDADRHLRACLKANPKDARVWRDFIAMLHERGNRKACFDAVAELPEEADSEAEVWKFRGMAKEEAGDFSAAADAYRQAIERNPNIIEYHYRLGIVEERLGHREQASEERRLAKVLREARAELPKAYTDFLDARDNRQTGGPDLHGAIEKLASVCRTLGYIRVADAWKELEASLPGS